MGVLGSPCLMAARLIPIDRKVDYRIMNTLSLLNVNKAMLSITESNFQRLNTIIRNLAINANAIKMKRTPQMIPQI